MKKVTGFLLIAGLCAVQACNNGTNKTVRTDSNVLAYGTDTATTSKNMNTDTNSSTAPSAPIGKDVADFTTKAATGGMMEVQLARIAQTKAMDPRVKAFASMMLQDHTSANDELNRLAAAKHINLPATLTADDEKKISDLNKKTGKDFDKAYMNMMVDDHKKDVSEFEKAGKGLTDPDLKNFAMKTLPTLQKHLDSAKAIKK